MSANFSSTIRFLPVPPPGPADKLQIEFDCEISTQVNDLVYQDVLTENKVLSNVDNTQSQPSIGVVVRKPSPTKCVVLIIGIAEGYTGLTLGSKVFLGTDGSITTTKPATDYVQTLGTVVSSTQIFFVLNTQRVLQV